MNVNPDAPPKFTSRGSVAEKSAAVTTKTSDVILASMLQGLIDALN